jgi:putative transposase
MTSTKGNDTLMPELLKLVTSNGTDSMREVFQKLLNEAMKIERAEALGADPYERTSDRTGYANGFKPKTIQTRMGAITVEIPQARGVAFYPQSLEKGIRSERAREVPHPSARVLCYLWSAARLPSKGTNG